MFFVSFALQMTLNISKIFSDCLFYFCSTCADSITNSRCHYQCYFHSHPTARKGNNNVSKVNVNQNDKAATRL